MVTQIFEDEIVSATKFREKQSHWLSVAKKRPITITSGENRVTLVDRELMRDLYLSRYYLEMAVQLCDESVGVDKYSVLPWLKYISAREQKEFKKELIQNMLVSITTDNWENVTELLDDWKATAETYQNKEAMRNLLVRGRKEDYVPLKEK